MNYIKKAEKQLQAEIFVQYIKANDTISAAKWAEEKEFGEFEWDLAREILRKQANSQK